MNNEGKNQNDYNIGKLQQVKEGTIIINEGEPVSTFYKVVSGNAELYYQYGKKDEYLLGICGENKYFGEVSFLSGAVSKYTAVAGTDMLLLSVKEEDFGEYVSRKTHNALDIMKNLAKKVEALGKHIDLITTDIENMNQEGEAIPVDLKSKISQYKHWKF